MSLSAVRHFGYLLLTFALLQTASAGSRSEAFQPDTSLNLANVQFQNDVRVFAVMAALNAAGFDHETDRQEITGVRKLVRERLQGIPADLKARLATFFRERQALLADSPQPQVAYTSLALLLSGPPEFNLDLKESEMPRDVLMVQGFEHLVREIYRVGNLQILWNELQDQYRRELAAYEPLMRSVMRETLDYFRISARIALDRQILLIPDLLDVRNIVNARNLETVYYIVVGPSDDPAKNRDQLQHEYLHFLIDPLVQKFAESLLGHDDLLTLAQRQPGIRRDYQNKFVLVATESLVNAVQLSMNAPDSEEQVEAELVNYFRDGLILAPYFYQELESFGRSELISLPIYVESLIQGIDDELIASDEKRISSLEATIKEREAAEQAAREREIAAAKRRARIIELFQDAEEKLRQGLLEESRAQLYEVLRLQPNYGNAFFYLAQIAYQRREFEDAIRNYQLAATSEGLDAGIRARSQLVIGKIKAHQQKFDEAREIFEQVAALSGDLRGAPAEARKLLEVLPAGTP